MPHFIDVPWLAPLIAAVILVGLPLLGWLAGHLLRKRGY